MNHVVLNDSKDAAIPNTWNGGVTLSNVIKLSPTGREDLKKTNAGEAKVSPSGGDLEGAICLALI